VHSSSHELHVIFIVLFIIGVVATRRFYTNDIVCDYHGKVIPAAEGRAIVQSLNDEPGYCFFFKAGERELCVDSQNYPCESHPLTNTFGRRINHSSKMPNLKPFHCKMKINGEDKDIILFKALKDITVGTQPILYMFIFTLFYFSIFF